MIPNASLIITSRDEDPRVLLKTIENLLDTTAAHRCELIVVDDGSVASVSLPGYVKLFRNNTAIGVSRARRMGASFSHGRILTWLDAHMSFAPDWFDQMLKYADTGSLLCSAFCDYELRGVHCWGADFNWCGERDYLRQLV
jgi:glycosyltransferase involved in cell wall biosynthesis